MIVPPPSSSTVTASSPIATRLGVVRDHGERRPARAPARPCAAIRWLVLDVVAERRKADLGRLEADLRRPQEPRGVVDEPHDAERRGMVAALLPDPQRLERRDRAAEQGRGPVVGGRGRPATSTVATLAAASAIAAVRPAGPPPTTTTSANSCAPLSF